MVIDSHGHVTAPDSLYVYKAQILAHRGAHGRGGNLAVDDDVKEALNSPVFGGSSHLQQLKEVGTDLQLISPRPYQMMTSENPRLVQWFVEETNNIIAKQVELYPDTFRGVCGLPLTPGVSPRAMLPYLETCIKERGFVGFLLNPDPGECSGVETPPLGDRFWYPLYEKMVELDIPGHIHSAGCRSERLPYSLHFINEESIGVVSLLNSDVFKDFPTLKILVSHGGGAIPYQFARFEAGSLRRKGGPRFSDQMRHLYYDTVLYSKDALELLFKTVGVDRCVFGTERPGVGTVMDPRTGRWLDETRFTIESIDWLTDADKKKIFEDNAKKLFNLKVPERMAV
jgi:predicted TIM-barrel fold metal-dependent hydrolase